MAIQLVPIDRNNYMECINLSVGEEQKRYVAPNSFSLAQAAYEPDMYPLAVYDGDQMVGFILYDLDPDLEGWSMSRFMIDRSFQGKGLGKLALDEFLRFFFAAYPADKLYTSVETDNPTAAALYESRGFRCQETFEYDAGGEHYREMRMLLEKL